MADKSGSGSRIKKFNDRLAAIVTNSVATMWCAYIFAALAIWGGTAVDWHNALQVVQWISQTFLQLVLLSIIMVGQRVLSEASDFQAKEMHDAVMQELALAREERAELLAIDKDAQKILGTSELLGQALRQPGTLRHKVFVQNPKSPI